MKIYDLMVLVMLFCSLTGISQTHVFKGKVINEIGQPVENAVLKVNNSHQSYTTDKNGEYSISADSGSTITLIYLNYPIRTIKLVQGMEITLFERSIALDNIVIKADPLYDVPHSNIIFDDVKATTQPRSAGDLFKDIPGFGIQKRGAYAAEPIFRAFRYEQLNIQYDGGMRITNACPNRMDPITTHIIPEEIEQIEIIRGPFSVRFGQNFGGVINLVSKSINDKETGLSGTIESGFETNGNNFTARGSLLQKTENFDLELNGSYRNYGDYEDGNGTEVPSSFTTTEYSAKLGYNPSENQRMRLTWRQSFARDIDHAGLPMDSPYDDSYMAGIDYKISRPSDNISAITVKGFYSYVDHLMTNENRPSFAVSGSSSNVFATNYGGKAEVAFKPNDHFMIFTGLDGNFTAREGDRIRTIKMANGKPLPEPIVKVDKIWQDAEIDDIGIFAEGKWVLSETSTMTMGIRTDFVDAAINDPEADFEELYGGEIEDQSEVNLGANISYQFHSHNFRWNASFGRGERTADMIERYINHFNIGIDPYEYVGNPYLDPEVNYQLELSGQFKNENYQLGASVFYSFLEDYISAIVDPGLPRKYLPTMEPKFAKRFINLDKAYQTGFEAFFNYALTDHLSLETDIAYTYGQNEDFDEPLPQITPLTGHIGIKYDKNKYWINLKSRLVDNQDRVAESFGEEETPGFTTFDISGGYVPVKGLSIGAAVLNIFDKAYYEHLNFSYNGADLLNGRIYEPGRNFTVYVTYNF